MPIKANKRVDSDGFILVNNRRRHRLNAANKNYNKLNVDSVIINESSNDLSDGLKLSDHEIVDKVWSCVKQLTNSDYMKGVSQSFELCLNRKNILSLSDNKHEMIIICYGLGNFSDDRSSIYQLALLIAIKQLIKCKHIYIYDPIFTANERNILENQFDLSICCDESSDECHHMRSVNDETKRLYYMPHCHKSLFNCVLHTNWCTTKLDNIYILGNSFNNMLDTIASKRIALKSYAYLYNIVNTFPDTVIECNIFNNFIFKDIFNDFSIHAFNVQNLHQNQLQQYFSEHKPLYDSSEEYD